MEQIISADLKNLDEVASELEMSKDPGRLGEIVDTFFEQQKPYLSHRYGLRDLSGTLSIPVHKLSAFFNRVKRIHFTDFVNQHRVGYCIEFLKKSEIKRMNLAQLAAICGFNNRNTFTASFKKITGQTPSYFMRNLQ